ncbi:MAG: serine hydrolase [Candidatus Sulfopaludibacter sp.]|nr:serine hydrolase [Candidatus Sulfopaludibacter sp.]
MTKQVPSQTPGAETDFQSDILPVFSASSSAAPRDERRLGISRRGFLACAAPAILRAQQNAAAIPAKLAEDFKLPGLSVAMARHGKMVFQQAFGWAGRDAREKLTPQHRFRIASVSKPITSVALFTLIEAGRLRLDDTVFGPRGVLGEAYGNPPYNPHIEDIRIVHLMTHTGGGWTNDDRDPMFRHPEMNHAQLIRWTLANQPLVNPPGEKYAYSNFGYCVLGRVIEKLTGQPYSRYVQEKVLAPCGIRDMQIAGNALADRAPGEVVYYQPEESPYGMNVRRMDSHGGWIATAADLVNFAGHMDAILKPGSLREMTTATAANAGYAKGWAVNKVPNWWHTGSLPGTATLMVRTESGFCWAALTNTRSEDLATAMDRMMWQLSGKF